MYMAAGVFKLLLVYLILVFQTDKFRLYATGKTSKVNTFIKEVIYNFLWISSEWLWMIPQIR